MKVATAAYDLDWLDSWAQYEDKLDRWVSEAAGQGAELLVFPEYGAMELVYLGWGRSGGRSGAFHPRSFGSDEELRRPCISALRRNTKHYILGASAPVVDGSGHPVNRAAFYAPDGGTGSSG